MAKILIKIKNDGEYCGQCKAEWSKYGEDGWRRCKIFGAILTGTEWQYLKRCKKCLAAEVKPKVFTKLSDTIKLTEQDLEDFYKKKEKEKTEGYTPLPRTTMSDQEFEEYELALETIRKYGGSEW